MLATRKNRILYKLAEIGIAVANFPNGRLHLMVSRTPELLARGLSGVHSLPSNTGMLFVMPAAGPAYFWMRNTHIPLDIAFLDENMSILSVQTMEPETGSARHDGPVKYAIEARAGWFDEHGVKVGDAVQVDGL